MAGLFGTCGVPVFGTKGGVGAVVGAAGSAFVDGVGAGGSVGWDALYAFTLLLMFWISL